MFRSRSPLFVLAVAFALACGTLASAEELTVDNCKVVKIDGSKLTLETAKGDRHSAEVAADAKVTVDGKDAKLGDMKDGMKIKVTVRKEGGTPTIVRVEGSTK